MKKEELIEKWECAVETGLFYGRTTEDERLVVYMQDFVEDLKQLEEPKQEKPVIPQFIADYIEIAKQDINLIRVFDIANNYEESDKWKKEYGWIRGHYEVFARAWLDGYTVEKEKLYQVRLPMMVWDEESSELQEHWYYLVYDYTSDETRFTQSLRAYEHYQNKLSETLIKSIDERFWAFAEEVTE